jgi:hypothetical protein
MSLLGVSATKRPERTCFCGLSLFIYAHVAGARTVSPPSNAEGLSHQFSVHVDFNNLRGKLARAVDETSRLVSIGFQSGEPPINEGLRMPGTGWAVTYSDLPLWTEEQVRDQYCAWVLRIGLRDAMEAFGSFLDECHEITAYANLVRKYRKQKGLIGQDLFEQRESAQNSVDSGLTRNSTSSNPGSASYWQTSKRACVPSTAPGTSSRIITASCPNPMPTRTQPSRSPGFDYNSSRWTSTSRRSNSAVQYKASALGYAPSRNHDPSMPGTDCRSSQRTSRASAGRSSPAVKPCANKSRTPGRKRQHNYLRAEHTPQAHILFSSLQRVRGIGERLWERFL